ncbi:MAG: extracellular solute-binding protein [Roseicyclus sp.]
MKSVAALASTLILVGAMASAQDTTLTYMMWDPDQIEIERETIAEFEAANPGVTVEALAMPPSDYWPRLSALAAAGDLPDVFAMSSGFVKG